MLEYLFLKCFFAVDHELAVLNASSRRRYSTVIRQLPTPETFVQCHLSRAFKTSRTFVTQAAKPGYPVRSNFKTRREQKFSPTRTSYVSICLGTGL